jgi:hypothetical protein
MLSAFICRSRAARRWHSPQILHLGRPPKQLSAEEEADLWNDAGRNDCADSTFQRILLSDATRVTS